MVAGRTAGEWWRAIGPRPQSPPGMKRRFILVVGVGILALNYVAPADPTLVQRLLASAIMVLAATPSFVWLCGKEHRIPFLPLLAGIYGVYFGLPIFVLVRYSRHPIATPLLPDVAINQALLLSLLGLISLLIAYYGFSGDALRCLVPRVSMRWGDYRHVKRVSVVLSIVGLVAFWARLVVRIPIALELIVSFATDLTLISIVVLFVLQLTGRLTIGQKWFLWIVVTIRGLMGLGAESVGEILRIILPLILAYGAIKHRIPWKTILVAGLLFFVLRPVKGEVSPHGDVDQVQGAEAGVRYLLYVANYYVTLSGFGYVEIFEIFLATWTRLAHLMTFAEVVELTPGLVPFWGGETLYPILLKPIPRFIYPDKPMENLGGVFGHRYGLLQPDDFTTAYNVPHLIEFYANFGVVGVLAGMFLVGLIYKAIYHVFAHPSIGLGGIVACIHIYGKLAVIENNVSGVFGQLFYLIPYFALLHLVMTAEVRHEENRSVGCSKYQE